jgi:hypothetical protein
VSEQHLEAVRRACDAFNRRDWAAFVATMHEDIAAEPRLAAKGGHRGYEGLRRWWDELFELFPDYRLEIEELRDLGDVTLVHLRGTGHGAASAAPVVDPIWQPMAWRDGRCIWWRLCATEEEALAAIRERTGPGRP